MSQDDQVALFFGTAGYTFLILAIILSSLDISSKAIAMGGLFLIVAIIFFIRATGETLLTEEQWKKRNEPTTGPKK